MKACRILLRAAALGFFLLPVLHAAPEAPPAKGTPPAAGAPVRYQGTELFRMATGIGAFSAEDRARALESRLAGLDQNPFAPPPSLRILDEGNDAQVIAGDLVLFTVTEADARAAGATRMALAETRRATLEKALAQARPLNRLKSLATHGLLALLTTLAAWILYRALRKVLDALRAKLEPPAQAWMRNLRFQDLELVSETRAHRLLAALGRTLEGLVFLVVGYTYLSVLFSLFPWTRGLAWRLLQVVLQPILVAGRAVLAYLPNLFFLAIIFLGTRFVLRLLRLVFEALQDRRLRFAGFHPDWADPTLKLARMLALAFALVLAFPYLPGSGSEAFKGVSLFLGVIVSFGSSGAMGNVIAGVLITYMRPFQLGDRVQIGEAVGDVIERTALATRIRTIKNVEVSIPNATVLSSLTHNFTACAKDRGLILHSTVTIGYDAPWRTVHALLLEAARATEELLDDPAPFVLQTSLDDFYVSYQVNATARQPERMAEIQSRLHENIQEAFHRAGVEIMSPHYRALRDGNTISIPEALRPEGYRAPGFRMDPGCAGS